MTLAERIPNKAASGEMPALEMPAAGNHGSGAGNYIGYKVEVRTSYCQPTKIGDFTIDNIWREVPIREGATPWGNNIPVSLLNRRMLLEYGLVSYAAAEAHRWALVATIDASNFSGSLCVQTRLVQVELRYRHETEELGVTQPMNSDSIFRRKNRIWKRGTPATSEAEVAEAEPHG
jgi:hypothetical protein